MKSLASSTILFSPVVQCSVKQIGFGMRWIWALTLGLVRIGHLDFGRLYLISQSEFCHVLDEDDHNNPHEKSIINDCLLCKDVIGV